MPLAGRTAAVVIVLMLIWAIVALPLGNGRGPPALPAWLPDLVEVPPGMFKYRASGDFTRDGRSAQAPMVTIDIAQPIVVMKHQVTSAEYRRCADAYWCPSIDQSAAAIDVPVVGVNWHDAEAYASWLSDKTGQRFRLMTDEEWAYVAGERFQDDALPDGSDASPGRRELAAFDRDSIRAPTTEKKPLPLGSFGTNQNGLIDVAGNVWEWTSSCFERDRLDARGNASVVDVNCGVRAVEGRHRTYVTDFVRDPRGGGCSLGKPPANLGIRLVRDNDPWRRLGLVWQRI